MSLPVFLAASLGAALVVVLVFFAIGAATNRHRVVDVAWGTGFAAADLSFVFRRRCSAGRARRGCR
ncbi:hypothetical protein ABT369_56880 [Dactylosporangium sp. NPDC000244]|uniref:hypothetical protein n=1 Tax=Dactylosporangium sp. NPDC000244 TaxID=3154365 RepID=UPI003326981B